VTSHRREAGEPLSISSDDKHSRRDHSVTGACLHHGVRPLGVPMTSLMLATYLESIRGRRDYRRLFPTAVRITRSRQSYLMSGLERPSDSKGFDESLCAMPRMQKGLGPTILSLSMAGNDDRPSTVLTLVQSSAVGRKNHNGSKTPTRVRRSTVIFPERKKIGYGCDAQGRVDDRRNTFLENMAPRHGRSMPKGDKGLGGRRRVYAGSWRFLDPATSRDFWGLHSRRS